MEVRMPTRRAVRDLRGRDGPDNERLEFPPLFPLPKPLFRRFQAFELVPQVIACPVPVRQRQHHRDMSRVPRPCQGRVQFRTPDFRYFAGTDRAGPDRAAGLQTIENARPSPFFITPTCDASRWNAHLQVPTGQPGKIAELRL